GIVPPRNSGPTAMKLLKTGQRSWGASQLMMAWLPLRFIPCSRKSLEGRSAVISRDGLARLPELVQPLIETVAADDVEQCRRRACGDFGAAAGFGGVDGLRCRGDPWCDEHLPVRPDAFRDAEFTAVGNISGQVEDGDPVEWLQAEPEAATAIVEAQRQPGEFPVGGDTGREPGLVAFIDGTVLQRMVAEQLVDPALVCQPGGAMVVPGGEEDDAAVEVQVPLGRLCIVQWPGRAEHIRP